MARANDTLAALVNRRDVTDARTPVVDEVMPQAGGDPLAVLERIAHQLASIVANQETANSPGFEVLTASNGPVGPGLEIVYEYPGINRYQLSRSGTPPNNTSIPTTGALIYGHNPNRLGIQIVNYGLYPVLIYLGYSGSVSTATAGFGSMWLSADGGAWDGKIGDLLWTGSLYGVGQGGTTTLAGIEV